MQRVRPAGVDRERDGAVDRAELAAVGRDEPAGQALRVVTLDGRVILELSDADPEVSYGAAEFGAAEEMGRQHGFWWSPDGRQLLATRVNERGVASWWLGDPSRAGAEPARQRYPFAGGGNPVVTLLLAGLDGVTTAVHAGGALPYLMDARWDGAGPPLLTLQARDHRYREFPAEHPEAYHATSLLPLAAGLTRPLLLVHGLADDNVHPRHSLLLSAELLAAGREHEMLLLPGTTHMVWQPGTIEQLLRAHVRFFRRWLPAPRRPAEQDNGS